MKKISIILLMTLMLLTGCSDKVDTLEEKVNDLEATINDMSTSTTTTEITTIATTNLTTNKKSNTEKNTTVKTTTTSLTQKETTTTTTTTTTTKNNIIKIKSIKITHNGETYPGYKSCNSDGICECFYIDLDDNGQENGKEIYVECP